MPLYVASHQFISITNNLTYILILMKFNFNFSKTILLHCSPGLLDKKDCGFGVPAWRLM